MPARRHRRRHRRRAGLLGLRTLRRAHARGRLAQADAVVVSGLARGIDGEAHRGALGRRRKDGRGARLRRRPRLPGRARRAGAGDRGGGGLVVSEYEPGVEPAPWRFPARNRIIAGLAGATVVVEARERSGALITADFALEEGREVLAVPGEITSALAAGRTRSCARCDAGDRRRRRARGCRSSRCAPQPRPCRTIPPAPPCSRRSASAR